MKLFKLTFSVFFFFYFQLRILKSNMLRQESENHRLLQERDRAIQERDYYKQKLDSLLRKNFEENPRRTGAAEPIPNSAPNSPDLYL